MRLCCSDLDEADGTALNGCDCSREDLLQGSTSQFWKCKVQLVNCAAIKRTRDDDTDI